MKITADFPGGNIRVLSIENNTVTLEQDLKGTAGWWFYWCFRVDDPPAGKVVFRFQNGEVVPKHGPVTGTDGIAWVRHPEGFLDHRAFCYTFEPGEKSRYFSFSYPYTVNDFDRFLVTSNLTKQVLCKSEQERDIPFVTFGTGDRNIFFTARHHCCESPASFVLEGILRAALASPYLCERFTFHVFPFADIDGVQNGDQGKDRPPHDHNRDYTDAPLYAFTRAIMAYARNNAPTFFFDLHSPGQWGGIPSHPHVHDRPHLHLSPETGSHPLLEQYFVETLMQVSESSAVVYDGTTFPFSPEKQVSSKYFFKEIAKAAVAITIETPYSGDRAHGHTADDLRRWGGDIAKTIEATAKHAGF